MSKGAPPVIRPGAPRATAPTRERNMNDTRDRSLEERFQPEAGPPGHRGQSLVTQVLRQAGKAGGRRRPGAHRPGAGLGRGHVAARFVAGSSPRSRRVTIKTRLVNLRQAGRRSVSTHLRYIEREGDRKSTRLNSSHVKISYAVFCLKKKKE